MAHTQSARLDCPHAAVGHPACALCAASARAVLDLLCMVWADESAQGMREGAAPEIAIDGQKVAAGQVLSDLHKLAQTAVA